MQTLLRDPMAGLMHSLLYFGFVSLFIVTVISETDHQLPDRFKFLHGQTYEAYSAGAEIAGLMFLAGIVWAISRRYAQRPYRIRIKTRPEDALILGTFLVIGAHRVPRRGRAHRGRGQARLREVVVRRLRARDPDRHVVDPHAHDHAPLAVGRRTWSRSSRSSRSCRPRSCATCSRRR